MKKNIWICAFATICAGAILTGCGKEKPAPQESQLPEPTEVAQVIETETQEPAAETHEGEARSPFTGKWIDETVAFKRPVAVMTENTKVTLPQYGLGQADVIYECPVEGGITRLMAIYQDGTGGQCQKLPPVLCIFCQGIRCNLFPCRREQVCVGCTEQFLY